MPNRMVEGTMAAVSATLHGDGRRRRQSRIGGTMHLDTPATENAEQHATKLTKRYLMKSFWVLLVPFLFPSALAAEPSLAETVQYVGAKLASWNEFYAYRSGADWWNVTTVGKEFRLNGQSVTYSYTEVSTHPGGNYTYRREYMFQLSALSTTVAASSEEVQELHGKILSEARFSGHVSPIVGVVRISCARKGCISAVSDDVEKGEKGGPSQQTTLTFYVDPDHTERVQKALTHAIKLSGGKDELF